MEKNHAKTMVLLMKHRVKMVQDLKNMMIEPNDLILKDLAFDPYLHQNLQSGLDNAERLMKGDLKLFEQLAKE